MCDTLKTTRGGSDGDSLFRRGLTYRDNDTLLCLVVLLGSIGHIHYPKGLGSTIPGDTPTVAKLPDEGSPLGTITPSMNGIIMGRIGVGAGGSKRGYLNRNMKKWSYWDLFREVIRSWKVGEDLDKE